MNLETMWRTVAAPDVDIRTLIQAMVTRWSDSASEARFFRSSANFLYVFDDSGKPYFLRFNHEDERDAHAIKQELAFVNHLGAKGLKVATPVPSQNAALIETVTSNLGTFHAVVFEAVEGEQREAADLTPELFREWGRTLGDMHRASSTYPRSKRRSWQNQLSWVRFFLPEDETAARSLADKLEQSLRALPVSQDKYGLIHFDFELDNLVWRGNEATVLDFDDCIYMWFAADVAFALRDLFDDDPNKVDLNSASLKAFVEGYRTVRALSDEDLALLPLFLRFHNLVTFAKLFRSREGLTQAESPEWMQELDVKLARKVEAYRRSFNHPQ